MSCCAPPLLPAKMLALSQVSDGNNNSPGCGVLALKMMSSRGSLLAVRGARARCSALGAALQAPAGPKRCLFGAPPPADTQRLLREDQDAVKSRMARRWGWDLDKEGPAASSTWQWEAVRPARRHPYAVATPRTVTPAAAVTPVPAMLSSLAATPTSLNTSSTSSSSGTSTLPGSPASPAASPPTLRPPTSWASDSEDSCCGDSDSDSSTTCGTSPRPVPVQTRITDFWRTRRCSTSEGIVKANPAVPAPTPPTRTCPV